MLKFAPSSKDRLFYDQYEYGICVSVTEAGVLRAKTLKALEHNIEYRNSTRRQYWGNIQGNIDTITKATLVDVWKTLDAVRDSIKLIVSYNVLYIYSNDISVLAYLADLPQVKFCSAVQAVVDKPRDVVFKTDPKFKFRSYFRDQIGRAHV